MVVEVGALDLQNEVVDKVVKNYAMENFTMLQVCTVVKTNAYINTYYTETDSICASLTTTGDAVNRMAQIPRGAGFPQVGPSWTEVNERVVEHGADANISWMDVQTDNVPVLARTMERVGQAIAHSIDTAIITELATTTNTAAAVATWDNATESLQNPIKDILKGIAAMQVNNRNPYKGGFIIMHPNNFMDIMANAQVRNAGQFGTNAVVANGRVGTICGQTIIVNNASTENTILMCIGKAAMAWYEAAPLQTDVKIEAGQYYRIRAFAAGVPVLINNYAAYKITAA